MVLSVAQVSADWEQAFARRIRPYVVSGFALNGDEKPLLQISCCKGAPLFRVQIPRPGLCRSPVNPSRGSVSSTSSCYKAFQQFLDQHYVTSADLDRMTNLVKVAEEYVKVLSLDFIASMNNGNFKGAGCQHFSPRVNATHDAAQHSHHATSRFDTLAFMSRFLAENPRYRTEVLDISVDVNEQAGTASVWILRTCEGLNDRMRRENVCHLTWQWQEDDWYCVDYEAIRYFPFFTIEALCGGGL